MSHSEIVATHNQIGWDFEDTRPDHLFVARL
jgi:hypothetical protein